MLPEAGLEPAHISILDFESIFCLFFFILKNYQNISKHRMYRYSKATLFFISLHFFILNNKLCSKIVVKILKEPNLKPLDIFNLFG